MKIIQEVIKKNLSKTQESSRVFHGRGKLWEGFDHIVIDYFKPHLLITLYKECDDKFIEELISLLKEIPDFFIQNILLQKRYLNRPELAVQEGIIPKDAVACERGLQYHLRFEKLQNIGFFLDMFFGREILERLAHGKKILNLFSYTCSLSVAAIRGGADKVVNVDMSKSALAIGEKNHILNNLDATKARFLPYDIMNSWNKIFKSGPYDIVVIDPPTNQGESFKVERDYYKIIKRLDQMTLKGSYVFACINSPYLTGQFLMDLFREYAPEFEFQEIIPSAFLDMEKNPEIGLKIVLFKKNNHIT